MRSLSRPSARVTTPKALVHLVPLRRRVQANEIRRPRGYISRPNQSEGLARFHREGQLVHGTQAAEARREVVRFEGGHGSHLASRQPQSRPRQHPDETPGRLSRRRSDPMPYDGIVSDSGALTPKGRPVPVVVRRTSPQAHRSPRSRVASRRNPCSRSPCSASAHPSRCWRARRRTRRAAPSALSAPRPRRR